MIARFLAAASSLLIGFLFIVPGFQVNGQDEHQEAVDAHNETVDTHQAEAGQGVVVAVAQRLRVVCRGP